MVVSSAYQAAALMSIISFAGALVFVGCGRLASKFGIDDEKAVSFFDATCLTLAAAAMIGDACLHLIPETFEGTDEDTADRYGALLVTGVVAVLAFEKICDACNTGTIEPFGFATGPLLAANFVASLTCFGGVALAASPWVAEREDEMVAFTAGSFLALALHSLAPRALATLDDAQTAQGRALRAVWLLALVLGVVRFLQFVGELEHAVLPD